MLCWLRRDAAGRLTIHVEVLASVLRPEARTAVASNSFNFTFGVAANADGSGRAARVGDEGLPELRRVLPATHEEAYRIMTRCKANHPPWEPHGSPALLTHLPSGLLAYRYKADLQQRAEDEAALREPRAEGD